MVGRFTNFLREHGLALLVYAILSLALSWPTLAHFHTTITGTKHEDPLHNLWILWHTQQALLGRESPFSTSLLYYPHGASLLTHGLGPLTGLFALPFWGWGPAAAHNAALLISLWLTGYCMYLLARSMGFKPGVALFAGIMVQASPMCLAGLFGHITKVFLGGLPLVLLASRYALDPLRSRWWGMAAALALLLTLLHNGYQFVSAVLAVGFLTLVASTSGLRSNRLTLIGRSALLIVCMLAVAGPLLVAIVAASRDPTLLIDISDQSASYQPDLLRFLVPNFFSRTLGWATDIAFPTEISSPELAVSLSWLGLGLCLLAMMRGAAGSRLWMIFTLLFVTLALGPQLRVFGRTFAIPLPYQLLTELPGLGFLRVPGRFMMMGFIGFGVTASFGLAWLTERWPAYRHAIVAAAIAGVLVESWPVPFPQQALPPVPRFYQDIANDGEQYGVFDLPINPTPGQGSYVTKSALYQVYQITHHKGIAAGYISRTYKQHPVFPHLMTDHFQPFQEHLLLNGEPAPYSVVQAELARNGYRYVVWHKGRDPLRTAGDAAAAAFVQAVFGEQAPLIDDELVRVYRVAPTLTVTFTFGSNWRYPEEGWRWGTSPATLQITSPRKQAGLLRIRPQAIYDPAAQNGLGSRGTLMIQAGAAAPYPVEIVTDRVTNVPLDLIVGTQTVTLSLAAGNFQPMQYGTGDSALLSFAIRTIELQTERRIVSPGDLRVQYAAGQPEEQPIALVHGSGWYEYEASINGRWAGGPASLFIYSPAPRRVQLRLMPRLIYEPASANGLGSRGVLQISANGGIQQQLGIQAGQQLDVDLTLRTGWNSVQIALAAGTFRPSDVQLGSGDNRRLSFAVSAIELLAH